MFCRYPLSESVSIYNQIKLFYERHPRVRLNGFMDELLQIFVTAKAERENSCPNQAHLSETDFTCPDACKAKHNRSLI